MAPLVLAVLILAAAALCAAQCTVSGASRNNYTDAFNHSDRAVAGAARGSSNVVFLATETFIVAVETLSQTPSLVAGSRTVAAARANGVGPAARFVNISTIAYNELLNVLFVIDEEVLWVVRLATNASTQLGTNRGLRGSPMSTVGNKLIIGSGGCIVEARADVLAGGDFVPVTGGFVNPVVGVCGQASESALDRSQPVSTAVGRVSTVLYNDPATFFFSTSATVTRWMTATPSLTEVLSGTAMVPGPTATAVLGSEAGFARGPCEVGYLQFNSLRFEVLIATPANPPSFCSDTSRTVVAMLPRASDNSIVLVFDQPITGTNGDLHRDVRLSSCTIDRATGYTTAPGAPPPPTSKSLSTLAIVLIACAAVVAVVIVVVGVAFALSGKSEKNVLAADGTATPVTTVAIDTAGRISNEPFPSSNAAGGGAASVSRTIGSPVTTMGRRTSDGEASAIAPEVPRATAKRIALLRQGSYQRGKLLGRGAFGSVYAALLSNGATVAMKELHIEGNEDEIANQTRVVMEEVRLLQTLQHPCLVSYYHAETDARSGTARIFMELVTGGSIAALVRAMGERLSDDLARKFARDITAGVAFLHQHNIVHRDLKCDNVLVDDGEGRAKITDFGTARVVNAMATRRSAAAAKTLIGTPGFMAPEVCSAGGGPLAGSTNSDGGSAAGGAGGVYGMPADVWSLGILVCEMSDRGRMPWPDFASPMHALMHMMNGGRPVLPEGLSPRCADFIAACLQQDPAARPSASELLSHPWLQEEA